MITKISGGNVILDNAAVNGLSVYIEDGKIKSITKEALEYDNEICADDCYVAPGFIDIHVHGGAGNDFSDGSVPEIIEGINYHAKHGTTTIFPTILSSSAENIVKAIKNIKSAIESCRCIANVCGVHLEGPYFSKKQCGAQNAQFITPPVKENYEKILREYGYIIRRWSFAPELESSMEFLQSILKYNIIPSIGHSDAKYNDVLSVYEKGCKLITHFYSCMSTVSRIKGFRIPGIIECGYLFDDMFLEVIGDGCHVPKELFRLIYKIKGSSRICLVTDAVKLAGSEKTEDVMGGVPCKIKDNVAYLMDESAFAGSIATSERLVRFCVKDVGINICDAVRMITKTPAQVMKLKNKGEIKTGYDADIVIFDKDINIKKVLVSGKEIN
ncbi:MAG: N-acetylglucosamine-6-phosphate deacetylase [Monoglobaceae bacterium]